MFPMSQPASAGYKLCKQHLVSRWFRNKKLPPNIFHGYSILSLGILWNNGKWKGMRSFSSNNQQNDKPQEKKRSKKGQSRHLQSIHWSQQVADSIYNSMGTSSIPIVELDPGPGKLTCALIGRGFQKIVCLEGREEYWETLENAEKAYEGTGTLTLMRNKFANKLKIAEMFTNLDDPNNPFHGIQQSDWTSEPPFCIVGSIPHSDIVSYVHFLSHSLGRGGFPYNIGRTEHFLFLSGLEVEIMKKPIHHWKHPMPHRTFFYNLFFDHEVILKVPLAVFDPSKINISSWKKLEWEKDYLFLTRISPKKELYSDICARENFTGFLLFLKQLTIRRSSLRLIPKLEQICPGIGLAVINMGYSMLDTVDILQSKDIPVIYDEIIKSPHFEQSALSHEISRATKT